MGFNFEFSAGGEIQLVNLVDGSGLVINAFQGDP